MIKLIIQWGLYLTLIVWGGFMLLFVNGQIPGVCKKNEVK